MRPYSPDTNHGRIVAGHDVHHRTADQPKRAANLSAKALKHAARQEGRRQALDQRAKVGDAAI